MVSHDNDNMRPTVVLIGALSADRHGLHDVNHFQCEFLVQRHPAAFRDAVLVASYADDSSRATGDYLHEILRHPGKVPARLQSYTPVEQMRTHLKPWNGKALLVLPPRGLQTILAEKLQPGKETDEILDRLQASAQGRRPEEGVLAVMHSPGTWRNLSEDTLRVEYVAFSTGKSMAIGRKPDRLSFQTIQPRPPRPFSIGPFR